MAEVRAVCESIKVRCPWMLRKRHRLCGVQVKRVVATLVEEGLKVRELDLNVSYRGKEQRWKRLEPFAWPCVKRP